MLAGGLDATYRAALAGPHTVALRVDVHDGAGVLLRRDLPFLGGGVSASLTSRVTRTLNLTVDESLYPWGDGDLLAPWGNELRVYRGVRYGDGREVLFPVFRGKIQSADMSSGGTCEIDAGDRAQEVDDADFPYPYNSSRGVNVLQQFRELVLDGVPDAEFGTCSKFWQTMPALTWEADRGQALDELATAVGAYWYALPDGRFVLRRVPWTVAAAPVVRLTDAPPGVRPGAWSLLLDALPRKTREGIVNSVTVVTERTDGSPPLYATAADDDPRSRTFAGGPFGRKHKLVRSQSASNQQAAASAARAYIDRSRALAETWSWSQVPDAAVELGDVIGLDARGRRGMIQVVASMQMPLTVSGQMTVSARSQMIGVDDDD